MKAFLELLDGCDLVKVCKQQSSGSYCFNLVKGDVQTSVYFNFEAVEEHGEAMVVTELRKQIRRMEEVLGS